MATTLSSSVTAKRLEGKVALITGGASGIGECTTRLFFQHGAKVVIANIQDDLGHLIVNDIGNNSIKYVHCDVTDESQVSSIVDIVIATYGKPNIVFNNAGIVDDFWPRIIDNKKSDFEKVLSVNLTSTITLEII